MKISAHLLLLSLLAVSCGSGSERGGPLPPELRSLAARILDQALADSLAREGRPFEATGVMTTEILQENDRVVVEDRFRLVGGSGQGKTITHPISHTITGDTTLLKDLYTFEDPKGNIRKQESQELAGLAFGADFSTILRDVLDSTGASTLAQQPGDTTIDGTRCLPFTFYSAAGEGRFWVAADSLDLRRLEVSRSSDYLIGRYLYRLSADFRRPVAGLLLPTRMSTNFEYRRLFTDGTGSIVVTIAQ